MKKSELKNLIKEVLLKEDKEYLTSSTKLNKGDIINYGKFGQFKFEVLEDLGDEVKIININKNTTKNPFIRNKIDYKGSWITRK